MFCKNCGSQIPDNALFCVQCGTASAAAAADAAAAAAAVSPAMPAAPAALSAVPAPASPVTYAQPLSYAPPAVPVHPVQPKKKKKAGCLIAIIILLVILAVIGFFSASLFGLFGPKDLGMDYTESDYQSALGKIGTDITFDGKSGEELRAYTLQVKKAGTKLEVGDYTWEHSDFQEKSFELTPAEATALLNEIAPGFYWFENQQIKIGSGGQVEASGTLLLNKALNDFYPELKSKVPFEIFPRVNLYAKGGISITENKLSLNTEAFLTGPIQGISPAMLDENAAYFEVLYTSVPGLIIHKLEVTDSGNFAVDALIPQKTVITKKLP